MECKKETTMTKNSKTTRRTVRALAAAALSLTLVFAATVPVAAATLTDVRTLRTEVATASTEIVALMQQARDAMVSVRDALQANRISMTRVAPDLAAALKTRLDALRQGMMGLVTDRETFIGQMVAFRSYMLNKQSNDAYDTLLAVQTGQVQWKTAVEGWIASAKSLASDITALASRTGPIWEQKKADQAAFLAALKEKKTALLANHEAVQAQVQQLNGLLRQVRAKIVAGALSSLSPADPQWVKDQVKDQLSQLRSDVGQTFDGSVAQQMQAFQDARTAADHSAALAALDQAIADQSQRAAALAGFIAKARTVLDKLDAAASASPAATTTPTPA